MFENIKTVNNTEAVVKGFNQVLADVGPEFAAEIKAKNQKNKPINKSEEVENVTAVTLKHICNLAFQVKKKKKGNRKVILPFKSGERRCVTNCRPVSLRSTSPKLQRSF